MLGIWVLACGLISTIFHSVQALGSFAVANALCYVDHAFAISAAFYFLKTCGMPSRRTLTIGVISLITLAVTYPGYAWLHSTWHYLSALTATKWAVEGSNDKWLSNMNLNVMFQDRVQLVDPKAVCACLHSSREEGEENEQVLIFLGLFELKMVTHSHRSHLPNDCWNEHYAPMLSTKPKTFNIRLSVGWRMRATSAFQHTLRHVTGHLVCAIC